ncbi:TPA: phenylacetic acid degradation protein [Candidatus Sumerlaeota bacterium]|nr:phenylacetic acid degradation protein [Candidatus Sumerlaeota bacterium]
MSASPFSPFADSIGIEVLERSCGHGIAALTLEDRHCNSMGIAHGGAIFTLADHTFGAAQGACRDAVSLEMHIRFIRPAKVGQRLIATATRMHHGKQTCFYQINIHDAEERLIACVTATGHVFEKREG